MNKTFKKWLLRSSLALFTMLGLLVAFILYPNNLFAKKKTYKVFTIYSAKAISGYEPTLEKAISIVKASELYDSNFRYDIFLTNETFYKNATFKVLGPSLARSIDNNILLNIHADFGENLLISPNAKRDLTQTIAHEMVHCLQVHRYGMTAFNPVNHPPLWKLEGYPEYISRQEEIDAPGYRFTETLKKLKACVDSNKTWVEGKPGHFDPLVYFKGRVMIEYLADIKKMSYDQILDDAIKEVPVYEEMLAWYASH